MALRTNSPDLVGQTFGKLFVLERAEKDRKNRAWFWRCLCHCHCVGELGTLVQMYQGALPHGGDASRAAVLERIRDHVAQRAIPTMLMRTTDLRKPLRVHSCGCHAHTMRKQHVWTRR